MTYLMFKDETIGNVSIDSTENAWAYGTYELYKNGKRFEEFFFFFVNEDVDFDETRFDEEFIDDENWFINDDGKIMGITIPAIYFDDKSISFRFR